MLWKSKAVFKRTGIISLTAGLLVVLFGDWSGLGGDGNLATSYYQGGLYWAVIVQFFGTSLIIVGIVILIINHLRKE